MIDKLKAQVDWLKKNKDELLDFYVETQVIPAVLFFDENLRPVIKVSYPEGSSFWLVWDESGFWVEEEVGPNQFVEVLDVPEYVIWDFVKAVDRVKDWLNQKVYKG